MSKKNGIVGIQKNKIYPTNSRGGSGYTFKFGNPQIQFQIAPNPNSLVDVKSLRLNFKFNVLQSTGVRVDNQKVNGAGAEVKGLLNSRVGVHSVIETLRIQNYGNETIEEVKSYSRLLATTEPVLTSFAQYKNWNSIKSQAYARDDTEGIANSGESAVSLQLRGGIFNDGQPINTADTNGLKITIQLSPDNFVLNSVANAYYRLDDVTLTYNSLVLASPDLPSSSVLAFPTYNTFLNIVQSSDDQTSLLMNLSSVRSVFSNAIRSSQINNSAVDSLRTDRFKQTNGDDADIISTVHMRNNVKQPRQYDVNEGIAVNANSYGAMLQRDFIDSVRPYKNISNTLQSPITQGEKTPSYNAFDIPNTHFVGGVASANYDMLNTGAGVEFMNSMYSMRIKSKLEDEPQSVFTFALANSGLKVARQNVEPVQ